MEGIATLGCHYHFATILDICVKPICRGARQGRDSRLKRCFCTQAWHHSEAVMAGDMRTGPATRMERKHHGIFLPSQNQSTVGKLCPHPRLKPPPRPIGTLAINYAARLNLEPLGTPSLSVRCPELGASRTQGRAVGTGAALFLGKGLKGQTEGLSLKPRGSTGDRTPQVGQGKVPES